MIIKEKYIVLSASRMTDLPAFYPNELIAEVDKRLAKNITIHTLVLWTKHPASVLTDPLNAYLKFLKEKNIQIYIQLTISGLGKRIIGTDIYNKPFVLEPFVPDTNEAIHLIPDIINLTGSPDRIKLRIDPVVKLSGQNNQLFSSLPYFEPIVKTCNSFGIKNFTFSFLEKDAYKKVNNRLKKKGFEIISPSSSDRNKMQIFTNRLMQQYNVTISACCVNGFPESSCIDANTLEAQHPVKIRLNHLKPYSRPLCGCTTSIDIGGWPPKKCFSGCFYCYANPQVI